MIAIVTHKRELKSLFKKEHTKLRVLRNLPKYECNMKYWPFKRTS